MYWIAITKFVEMDDRVKFKEQVDKIELGNSNKKINVEPDKVEQFLKDWANDATNFKQQRGFISTQLHKGLAKGGVIILVLKHDRHL